MTKAEQRTEELAWPAPLHEQSGPTTFWSTVNLAEVIPGVPTPISFVPFFKSGPLAWNGMVVFRNDSSSVARHQCFRCGCPRRSKPGIGSVAPHRNIGARTCRTALRGNDGCPRTLMRYLCQKPGIRLFL
jgi:hypothetical protein